MKSVNFATVFYKVKLVQLKMKKLFIMLLCLSAFTINSVSAENTKIVMGVKIIDDKPASPGHSKTVVHTPCIYQDGYKFILSSSHPEYLINIVQDDEIVYSSVIPAGVTEFELPSFISGECTIQLLKGGICFWGNIEL